MSFILNTPHIQNYEDYADFIDHYFKDLPLVSSEERSNFCGEFPKHNRYFSNGDKPLVSLINRKGSVHLIYDEEKYEIPEGCFVFFDDNVLHSWVMKNSRLVIHYYKQPVRDVLKPIYTGTYCIDALF